MTTWTRRAGFVLAAVVSAALVSATAAASQEDDGEAPPEVTDEEREAHRAAFEEFRACMAEHGIELPDRPASPPDIDREAAETAFDACRDLVPPPPGVSAEELDAHRAAMEEFRSCLTDHGVEPPPPPPIPGLGGRRPGRLGENGEGGPTDEQREQFEAAAEACAEVRPTPLPGGRGPGPREGARGHPLPKRP